MHADHRELIQHLFALATGIAADGQEIAVQGQSPKLNAKRYGQIARQLKIAADDLATLVGSILAVLNAAEHDAAKPNRG